MSTSQNKDVNTFSFIETDVLSFIDNDLWKKFTIVVSHGQVKIMHGETLYRLIRRGYAGDKKSFNTTFKMIFYFENHSGTDSIIWYSQALADALDRLVPYFKSGCYAWHVRPRQWIPLCQI